eukprot:COSAG03_NODE_34_length_17821_cov_18.833531_10_plen_68_part_00
MATCCNEQPEPPRARQEGVFLNFPAPSEGAVRAPHTSSCGGLSKRARLQHRFTGFRADPAGECVGWG